MAFTSVITVDFSGTSHGSGDTFTVAGISNGESDTGVSYTDLQNGYTFQYTTIESSGFTVTAESGVCSGQDVGTVPITTPTPTPTGTPGATETATPTPTPTTVPGDATATPTPTPEPPQLQFYITNDYSASSEVTACASGELPGYAVYVTASVGSFENFVNNLGTFTTAQKTVYTVNGLTPGTEYVGSGTFYLADSDGVGSATHAVRITSNGVLDLAYPCTTPTPTVTPNPYVFYELRGVSFDGTTATGWNSAQEACDSTARTGVGEIRIDIADSPASASLPLATNTIFYTSSAGPGSEFNGGGYWYIHEVSGSADIAYFVDNSGQITLDPVICT